MGGIKEVEGRDDHQEGEEEEESGKAGEAEHDGWRRLDSRLEDVLLEGSCSLFGEQRRSCQEIEG